MGPREPLPPLPDTFLLPLRAQGLLAIGRSADALQIAEQAIAAAPEQAWAHALRAEALLMLGDLERALAASDNAIRLAPADGCGYRVRALALLRQGSRSECLEMARTACRLQADSPETLHVLVQAQLLCGEFDAALATAESLLRQAPAQAFAHEALGLVALRRSRIEEAVKHFRHALSLEPEQFTSLNNLALCLERQRRYDEALALLHRAIRLAPADPLVRFNLGRLVGLQAAPRQRVVYLAAAGCWALYQVAAGSLRGVPEADAQLQRADWAWLTLLFALLAWTVFSHVRSMRRLHPELRAFEKAQATQGRPQLAVYAGSSLLLVAGLMLVDELLRAREQAWLSVVVCLAVGGAIAWRGVRGFLASARLGKPEFDGEAILLLIGPVFIVWHKLTGPAPKRPFDPTVLLIVLVPALGALAYGLWAQRRRGR